MGEPVCWLARTCLECGRFLECEPVDGRCPFCGAEVPAPEP